MIMEYMLYFSWIEYRKFYMVLNLPSLQLLIYLEQAKGLLTKILKKPSLLSGMYSIISHLFSQLRPY